MTIKQKNSVVWTVRFVGIIAVFLVLVAAGEIVKTYKETQGREGPGSYYKLVKIIPEGKTFQVIEKKKNWYKVKYEDVEVWISGNSVGTEQESATRDPFESFAINDITSARASPTVLTAAIKGFWTRYSRSEGLSADLPVEGYDIPAVTFETFSQERSRTVNREALLKKYKLRSKDKKHKLTYEREHSIGFTCASAVADAPLLENEDLIGYVHSVGWYIAECTDRYDIRFNYYIIDTDRVNAVSCPGGYIVLTKGLLNLLNDESELAALLAHEMAHVIAGHGMIEVIDSEVQNKAGTSFDSLNRLTGGATDAEKDLAAIANRAVSIANSPKLDKYEFEADEMALRYMARSGYDLSGHVRLLNLLMTKHEQNIDIFDLNYRNHPDFKDRLKRTGNAMREYRNYSGMTFSENFRNNMVF
ncbi:M48 family metalloprotease [Candidatus Latescibacterota bacterium]